MEVPISKVLPPIGFAPTRSDFLDNIRRQRDVPHAVGDLLTCGDAVVDQFAQPLRLLGILLFVKKLPRERRDRVGIGTRGIFDPSAQAGIQSRGRQCRLARFGFRQNELSGLVLKQRKVGFGQLA